MGETLFMIELLKIGLVASLNLPVPRWHWDKILQGGSEFFEQLFFAVDHGVYVRRG
jgi:hypothetical protein